MQTETFRDPGADIQRPRSRHSETQEQRHSEIQEQTETEIQKHTETFRDPEADRDVQRSRSGQHGG